jgi:hypothetical protein
MLVPFVFALFCSSILALSNPQVNSEILGELPQPIDPSLYNSCGDPNPAVVVNMLAVSQYPIPLSLKNFSYGFNLTLNRPWPSQGVMNVGGNIRFLNGDSIPITKLLGIKTTNPCGGFNPSACPPAWKAAGIPCTCNDAVPGNYYLPSDTVKLSTPPPWLIAAMNSLRVFSKRFGQFVDIEAWARSTSDINFCFYAKLRVDLTQ